MRNLQKYEAYLALCLQFVFFLSRMYAYFSMLLKQIQTLPLIFQNQNQNCLLVIRPRTIIHQDLCLGKLVPSPHKRSKLSNWIYCTLRSSDKGICHKVPISYSLGEETGLVYISPSHWDLECQGVMIPGTPDGGNKVICGYTGCTLQTFVKHYESTIFPPLFQGFPFKIF